MSVSGVNFHRYFAFAEMLPASTPVDHFPARAHCFSGADGYSSFPKLTIWRMACHIQSASREYEPSRILLVFHKLGGAELSRSLAPRGCLNCPFPCSLYPAGVLS